MQLCSPFRPPLSLPCPASALPECALLGNACCRRRLRFPATGAPSPQPPPPLPSLCLLGKRREGRKKKGERRKRKEIKRVYYILDDNLWYFEDRIISLSILDLFALEQVLRPDRQRGKAEEARDGQATASGRQVQDGARVTDFGEGTPGRTITGSRARTRMAAHEQAPTTHGDGRWLAGAWI